MTETAGSRLLQHGRNSVMFATASHCFCMISFNWQEVTKVFIGASAMMSNGAVLSRVGTVSKFLFERDHAQETR